MGSEYEISNAPTPPWWVRMFPVFRRIWEIPVTQYLFKNQLKALSGKPLIITLVVLVYAIGINLLLLKIKVATLEQTGDEFQAVSGGFYFGVYLPLIAMFFVSLVAIIDNVFLKATLKIRKIVESGTIHSWLDLPITDSGLYNAILFRSNIFNLRRCESIIYIVPAIIIPFLLFQYSTMKIYPDDFYELLSGTYFHAAFPWLVAGPFLFSSITLYSEGIFLFRFSWGVAMSFSLVCIAACAGLTLLVRKVLVSMLIDPGMQASSMNNFYVELITIAFLFFIAFLLRKIGEFQFSRFRRPGFYEPEYASASGLGG